MLSISTPRFLFPNSHIFFRKFIISSLNSFHNHDYLLSRSSLHFSSPFQSIYQYYYLSSSFSTSSSKDSKLSNNNYNKSENLVVKNSIAMMNNIKLLTSLDDWIELISKAIEIDNNIRLNEGISKVRMKNANFTLVLPLSSWNILHFSAIFTQLYKFHPGITQQQSSNLVTTSQFQRLVSHLLQFIQPEKSSLDDDLFGSQKNNNKVNSRAIVHIIYSIAKTNLRILIGSQLEQLVTKLLSLFLQSKSIQSQCSARECANLVYSLGLINKQSSIERLRTQSISTVPSSLLTKSTNIALHDKLTLSLIYQVIETATNNLIQPDCLNSLVPQSISNLLLGFVYTHYQPPTHILSALIDYILSTRKLNESNENQSRLDERYLANTIYSFVSLGVGISENEGGRGGGKIERQMYEFLIQQSIQQINAGKFKSQEISNISWSIAKITPFLINLDSSLPNSTYRLWNESVLKSVVHEWFTNILCYLNGSSADNSARFSFESQGKSNIVWSLAQIYSQYVSFDHQFFLQLQRFLFLLAESIIQEPDPFCDFTSQNLGNLALSYSDLRAFHPTMMKALAKHLLQPQVLQQLNSQNVANLFLAFAHLGFRSESLSSALSSRMLELLETASDLQNIANSCYSLAVMGHLELPVPLQLLTKCIPQLNVISELPQKKIPIHLRQLHQIQLSLVQLHSSAKSKSPSSSHSIPLLSKQLADRCRKSMVYLSDHGSNSQRKVGKILKEMGIEFESEKIVPECGYQVDFFLPLPLASRISPSVDSTLTSISSPTITFSVSTCFDRNKEGGESEFCDPVSKGIIIQYDGPMHYLIDLPTMYSSPNSSSVTSSASASAAISISRLKGRKSNIRSISRLCASDRLINSHLVAAGYKVIRLAYFDLNVLKSIEQKTNILQSKITQELLVHSEARSIKN